MSVYDALTPRSKWSSSTSYVIVTVGAIVGLGNIIQFPYLISQYGGLFILFYLFFELMVSVPLLFAELIIGRRGKQNPVGAIDLISFESNASSYWRYIGWFSFIVSFLTLSYYTVQAAFPLSYFLGSLNVISIYGADEPSAIAVHGDVMTRFLPLEICFLAFLIATIAVTMRGINRGLEKISWIVVPTYFLILFVLAIYTSIEGNFSASLKTLFSMHPGTSIITVIIAAMGYAFFKLNVGMGSMIVYGSYLPYTASFRRSTIVIILFDIIISFLSYFIIYPLMLKTQSFEYELTNHNIIYIFTGIPNEFIIMALFFLAAVIAAWTATIAMAETVTVTLVERFKMTRLRASIIIFIGAVVIGSFAALTHTEWMHVMIVHSLPLQGIIKNTTDTILIPLSAIFIALFAGWIMTKAISQSELRFPSAVYRLWLFLTKYIIPACIAILLLSNIVSMLQKSIF